MFIATVLLLAIAGCVQSQRQLTLEPLPYAYDALEPVLSKHLMELHHDKHHQAYTTKTNAVLKAVIADPKVTPALRELANQPIEVILTRLGEFPEDYRMELQHQGGGYLNHKWFWSMLQKPTTTAAENRPTGALWDAIQKSFGSFDKFKEMFSTASLKLFGSGWIWLYVDSKTKELTLNFTLNQDNPIMFDKNHIVLMGIDLWEHAYYPVYENRRNEYVDNFWRIVNWPWVLQRYTEGMAMHKDL